MSTTIAFAPLAALGASRPAARRLPGSLSPHSFIRTLCFRFPAPASGRPRARSRGRMCLARRP